MSNSPIAEDQAAVSPSASGPAGALFEGQVGAHYLLTLLAEADPRGLPGVLVERVELQRAGEGHPLDDVIVRGVTRAGEPAVLEVQVKRTITFAPADIVFKDVVEQLARAYQKLDASHLRRQFAVATARTFFKITGAYQDVLRWAREVSSAITFIDRINRKKVGNEDMRTFVATVRAHLAAVGCANDDETVWQILRRFQILTFDYDAPGSQSLELAIERTRNVLEPEEASRASGFWKALTETAIRSAASGGDLDRTRLLEELALVDSFRVLGFRRNRAPRETLLQSASLAAADLRRDIAGAILERSAQIDAVRQARDGGRYIEIRGGPGVGKSGLLGMLVQQVLTEGCAIVLTPERTIAGGWLAFKSALGVDASPQAFLSDLASDGGAVLFVDSLDFFSDSDKRATVIDLVRSAAEVPNFQVIVTARTDFDKEEPNWIPADALTRLGRAPPVIVEEVGEEEIDELRQAAPSLRALLADAHPARSIARNLFRLSRLLEMQGSAEELRSEVDLLERWWKTADGAPDGRRDRARLLSELAENALAGGDQIATRASAAAVESLIASETLLELGLDRVTFRHDVLREWGVAAVLHDDSAKLDNLPLARSATASMIRGVELGARLALERSSDGGRWARYLDRVSPEGAHTSWRRWSLLAILRSELATTLLDRAAPFLFEQEGLLLGELIRTAIAVESRPLGDMLAAMGADVPPIPAGIYGPANSSWAMLVYWLLDRQADIPIEALPDIVKLFQSLGASMFFKDPLTPRMANTLADWLEEIEDAREHSPFRKNVPSPRFATAFGFHELQRLAEDVRQAFALMAARVPERAQLYLQGVLKRPRNEYTIRNIMKFRGMLAWAAPCELAELTVAGLIPRPEEGEDRDYRRSVREEVFTHLDSNLLPSSPAQGPFLDLLNAAPEQGFAVIRRLVDHAVSILSKGRAPGEGGLTLELPSGPRFFPWVQTYCWSRSASSLHAIESGLMALEAWSHARIERGDAPEQVIGDILGPDGSPAAFVLVAVDVLISHWPKTKQAAMHFLGCPELLSLDRRRQGQDSLPTFDLFGLGSIGPKEPNGPVRLATLTGRPSRKVSLEYLLRGVAHSEPAESEGLRQLLQAASARLGPPQPGDTFAEPRLMARHALNVIDPANWQQADGGLVYVSPRDEEEHVAKLQAELASQTLDLNVDVAIQNALEDPTRSGPELAEYAVAYAKRLEVAEADQDEDDFGSQRNAVISAAMIAARDGSDQFFDEHEEWARKVLTEALAAKTRDVAASLRDGIRFNPVAIATLGLVHLWRRRARTADRDALLNIAGRNSPEAAHGFGAGLAIIHQLDRRLVSAALRCALAAQIRRARRWDAPEEAKAADRARQLERVENAIAAERAWLDGDGKEPNWPAFPPHDIHVRSGIRIGKEMHEHPTPHRDRPEEVVYTQAAALWLRQLTGDFDPEDLDWLQVFVGAYVDWTARANGAGLERRADLDSQLDEWNNIFYPLLARTLLRLDTVDAAAAIEHAINVPDRPFFDIVPDIIPAIDELYFNSRGLSREMAVRLRNVVADRLAESDGWRREHDRSELSVEMRIGPAIGALFFNHYNAFGTSSCYLLAKGVEQVDPLLPRLSQLVESGPVPFTAMLTMNVLEVSNLPRHAGFFLSSALVWLKRQPSNASLWVDSGLGNRLVTWIETVMGGEHSLRSPNNPLRAQIDDVLARLIQVGVHEAHRVERALVTGA
ncbi:hypothetical protein U8C41_00355 (plasmid) [Sinorhizobium meliloti]|uniref:hypothetical protein n=1 Tax=Rhizobium meliloti TaxID=382 RepID=UPI000D1ECB96|nr:hypothetical protein [Sinorhizobium meliloti]RMI05384.1 hypothetical protein DA101_022915 [Sinorhizobium meliloti]RVG86213.1 hypothetical protein CN218_30500 [Sinorhizobium meliloti]RVK91624.1 hypothetical protein CN150_24895 [Sinorhizobium meliloti]WQO97361.1 hypothetical protein U8C41_00355 [Sinorhizobium meliloti]